MAYFGNAHSKIEVTDNDRYLIDINKDNLTRVIGFASTYDTKANIALTVILALTAYLIAELPPYIEAHAKHPQNNGDDHDYGSRNNHTRGENNSPGVRREFFLEKILEPDEWLRALRRGLGHCRHARIRDNSKQPACQS